MIKTYQHIIHLYIRHEPVYEPLYMYNMKQYMTHCIRVQT